MRAMILVGAMLATDPGPSACEAPPVEVVSRELLDAGLGRQPCARPPSLSPADRALMEEARAKAEAERRALAAEIEARLKALRERERAAQNR